MIQNLINNFSNGQTHSNEMYYILISYLFDSRHHLSIVNGSHRQIYDWRELPYRYMEFDNTTTNYITKID